MRRRRKKTTAFIPTHAPKDKYVPQWELVRLQTLVFILNFLDGTEISRARDSMLNFLKRHKKYKKNILDHMVENFDYLKKDSPKKWPKESIKEAKREINQLAKQVWSS